MIIVVCNNFRLPVNVLEIPTEMTSFPTSQKTVGTYDVLFRQVRLIIAVIHSEGH